MGYCANDEGGKYDLVKYDLSLNILVFCIRFQKIVNPGINFIFASRGSTFIPGVAHSVPPQFE